MVKYSVDLSSNKISKAKGDDVAVHFKHVCEIANAIRGMELGKAQKYLKDVIERKRCIPFRRYAKKVGRTSQAKEWNTTKGRWPQKAIRYTLQLLKNAEANAENKNLDVQNMYINYILAQKAQKGRRRTFRAHGRINPFNSHPCHIQIILMEKCKSVELPNSKNDKSQMTEVGVSKVYKKIRLTRNQLVKRKLPIGGGC